MTKVYITAHFLDIASCECAAVIQEDVHHWRFALQPHNALVSIESKSKDVEEKCLSQYILWQKSFFWECSTMMKAVLAGYAL